MQLTPDHESDSTNCASCALRTLAPLDPIHAPRFHGWSSLIFEVQVAKRAFSLSVQFVRVQVKYFQISDITVSPCPI
jgi:hypothetical protein